MEQAMEQLQFVLFQTFERPSKFNMSDMLYKSIKTYMILFQSNQEDSSICKQRNLKRNPGSALNTAIQGSKACEAYIQKARCHLWSVPTLGASKN